MDPATAKNEMRKLITEIILTPREDDRGLVYIVSGDVGLFNLGEKGALQSGCLQSLPLQYKFPISFSLAPYRIKRAARLRKAA